MEHESADILGIHHGSKQKTGSNILMALIFRYVKYNDDGEMMMAL